MRAYRFSPPPGFGSQLTTLGKGLLSIYGILYVLELLIEHWFKYPLASYLQLYPLQHENFHIYQLFTHPFLHNPNSPINFLISCLVFYFFAGPVENAFGQAKFLTLFYLSAAGATLCGLCFSSVSGFRVPFLGMMPSILSLIVVFGALNPEATILLMFILPVKAKYLSYGTMLIVFLTFLAKANPHGAYHLGGILFGYLYGKGLWRILNPQFIHIRYLEWRLKRKRSQFKVINGHKHDKDEYTPTYH